MSSLNRFTTLILLSLVAVSAIFFCSPLPQDPRDSSNTSVSLIIKDVNGKISVNSYADTVNKKFYIGSILKLPEYLDSLKLTVKYKDSIISDTTFPAASLGFAYCDTIWVERTLFTPGLYSATFTPYSSLGLLPVSANIMLVEAAIMPENHKPVITVAGNSILKPGDTCRLTVTTSDADVNQILTAATMSRPSGSELLNNKFTWAIPSAFTGLDTVFFIVTDNGYPVQSDTETVVITVTSTPHLPQISVSGDSIIEALKPCTLTIATSDEDAGQTLLVNMSGNPATSSIAENSRFIWTPSAADTGKHQIRFTVTDNGIPPLENSILFNLHVKPADSLVSHVNSAPAWSVDTLAYSMGSASAYTLNLPDICKDIDTDKITYSLLPGSPAGDTIINDKYSVSGSAAIVGTHFVSISAADPSGATDLLIIKLSIENSAVDTTGPQITLITPPGDSAKTADSTYTVDLICSDASGILSVTAALGEKKYPSVIVNGHYTFTVTGLVQDVSNTVVITATDSSAKASTSIKNAVITYKPKHTVAYDANTGTGSAPVDPAVYENGDSVLVKNADSLVKTGFTFTGWNSSADGKGTMHAAGTKLAMGSSNIVLFAQWTTNPTFTVTYYANTGTGDVPVDENKYETGTNVTISGQGNLTKQGFTFTGWNSTADGKGTDYAAGTAVVMPSANMVLYAQWIVKQYSLTYDGNGNSAGNVPVDANRYDTGTTVTVSGNTGGLVKMGYTFDGWNTLADGTGASYAPGIGSFEINANTKLFAKWTIKKYRLTYNGNDNNGGDVPDEAYYDSNTTVTVLGNINGLTKTGFDFAGWNTKANGGGVAMTASAKFTIKSDTTLYAQWTVKKYKLTIVPPINGTINLSGDVSVDSAAATEIKASAASGFKFKVWRVTSGSAIIADTNNANTTVKLTQGNASIKAIFVCLTFSKIIGFSEYSSMSYPSVAVGNDGCYYIAFNTESAPAIMKIDTNGNTIWKQTYTSGSQYGIRKTSDGCFLLAGTYDQYLELWKISPNKNEVFARNYLTTFTQGFNGKFAFETKDGSLIVGGGYAAKVLKTNSTGLTSIWEYPYSFTNFNDGLETKDGGYIFVGDDYGFSVTKTDESGAVLWDKTYSGFSSGTTIHETSDGGFIIGGQGGSYGQTPYSCGLIKISYDGTVEWQKTDALGNNIVSVRQTTDGGYIYLGNTQIIGAGGNDLYLVKANSTGDIIWSKTFGTSDFESAADLELTKDGGFIIIGNTADSKCWVIKTDENGNVEQ